MFLFIKFKLAEKEKILKKLKKEQIKEMTIFLVYEHLIQVHEVQIFLINFFQHKDNNAI